MRKTRDDMKKYIVQIENLLFTYKELAKAVHKDNNFEDLKLYTKHIVELHEVLSKVRRKRSDMRDYV